jgi:hypothetical protein
MFQESAVIIIGAIVVAIIIRKVVKTFSGRNSRKRCGCGCDGCKIKDDSKRNFKDKDGRCH